MSYFHISHKKFGNEYVYFKDKFWPKSPVVKYSPVYRQSFSRTYDQRSYCLALTRKTNIVAKSCAHSAEEITESAWEFESPMFGGGGGGSLNPVHKRGGGGEGR